MGFKGQIAQIPILTMPNDDITHPVPILPDLLQKGNLHRETSKGNICPLMLPYYHTKGKYWEGFTMEDHPDVATVFSVYSRPGREITGPGNRRMSRNG